MLKKHGDKSMKDLFSRNFSSVYVHYIPLDKFGELGNSRIIMDMMQRLARRIRADVKKTQEQRATTWTQFDSKQMSVVFDYAFKHLVSGAEAAFDLSQCMRQISLPDTLDGQFAEFLGFALGDNSGANFKPTAAVIASSLVRNSLKNNRTGRSAQR